MSTRPLLPLAIFLFLAAACFYQDPGWNGNSRLDLTRAIVEHGSLQIDPYRASGPWATEDAAFFNGHYYADKAPGSSLLAVPFYFVLYKASGALGLPLNSALVKHFLTSIVLGLAFAAAGVSMYRVAGRLGAPPRRALLSTLAMAMGTMLWPYSAVFYGHVIAAAFLVVALDLLMDARLATGAAGGKFFAAGLALGMAFITEYTAALVIAGLALYAAYGFTHTGQRYRILRAIVGVLGGLLPLAVLLAYNAAIYGHPFAIGYSHEVSDTFNEGMAAGIMGIGVPRRSVLYHVTLDPKFGLFWQSPVLLLAAAGYVAAFRHRTHLPEVLLSAYAISAMLLMNAGYYLWWGGHAFGPRLVIPMLPFFIVPLALLPSWFELPMGLLGLLSAGQMLIPLLGAIQPDLAFRPRLNAFFVDGHPFDGFSILYEHGLPLIARGGQPGSPPWTATGALGLPGWLTIPVLIAAGALLWWMLGRQEQRGSPRGPADNPAVAPGA